MSAPASVRGQTSESRLLEVGGVQGMWFPMEKARQLLGDVAALPKIRTELELVSRRLELEKERTTLLDRNVGTTEQIAIKWRETAEAQAKLREQDQAWWRSPVLWTAVGFVVGAGATIGIAVAVRRGTN